MERITNIMDQNNRVDAEIPTMDLLAKVSKTMKEIKEQSNKLAEQRSKAII